MASYTDRIFKVLSMSPTPTEAIHRSDYRPPNYFVPEVLLEFRLDEECTRVRSEIKVTRNPNVEGTPDLVLEGKNLTLIAVHVEGRTLVASDYALTATSLTIPGVPESFTVVIETELSPAANKSGEGLYISDGAFCTQMEAEGFRTVTFFPDRPDVMSSYTTRIVAKKAKYPVLLSNGNKIESGDSENGFHFVTWHDPFVKPCYLFALVAGDLARVSDSFVTRSGRTVQLEIYVEHGNEGKCGHAMQSLKQSMKWDEDVFGLEYDLDLFMIVAVSSFNMGAMENKGLNIFNSQLVLADPQSATDLDYERIQSVIAHEYFHNWTGNRVTVRDWFQLTLKEGLTVFRDQEFSADMNSRALKRIMDVRLLRERQFSEDAGPNAHPIRPESYIEINNFYTPTVYEKGAEVIRMIHTLIGEERFRAGISKYFELYDGQAVCVEDFIDAMAIVSLRDFSQFMRWYTQAKTPVCYVSTQYDAGAKVLALTIEQHCVPSAECSEKHPFHLPFSIGLVSPKGVDLSLRLEGENTAEAKTTRVLELRERREVFSFCDIEEGAVPSLLRNFSAPVIVEYEYTAEQLQFLIQHDSNLFSRFEAVQRLVLSTLRAMTEECSRGREPTADTAIVAAFGRFFTDVTIDCAFAAETLTLPSDSLILSTRATVDYDAASKATETFKQAVASQYFEEICARYDELSNGGPYEFAPGAVGARALRNVCLSYLASLQGDSVALLALQQMRATTNMTDEEEALKVLCHFSGEISEEGIALFASKWRRDSLVMNKWFGAQASSRSPTTLSRIQRLEKDPSFDKTNPNKLRALFRRFTRNGPRFHDASGSGYRFIADKIIEIDTFNPQIAAGFAKEFNEFGRLDEKRRALAYGELQRVLVVNGLSADVLEIVSKTVNA